MPDTPKPTKAKLPRKITEQSLRNIALYYLQRYASSQENLRRVLMRRVHRSAQVHDLDIDDATLWVDQLVEKLAKTGMVDDKTYAEGRTRALFRRGVSPRSIAQRLTQKGIEDELVQKSIAVLYENTPDPNLLAAIKFAKRRRLGPYRTRGDSDDRSQKDLASLARAGFDYQTAHKIISAGSNEELDDLADELSERFNPKNGS